MKATLFPRGSEWRKWDLHVHSPESIVNNYTGTDDNWSAFLEDIERLPPEFKVLGINDYIFLDGYRRLMKEKAHGRLPNIEMLLPVIELRLDKFGGTSNKLSRVNLHIIFSDEVEPDIIEQHFLNALTHSYQLSPEYSGLKHKWTALPTREALRDLGQLIIDSVPIEERAKFRSPLSEGFNNLCLSLDDIKDALKSHYFNNKFLTAVGKTEWADIKWNDHSIAEKKNIVNSADLVFVAAESPAAWQLAKDALIKGGVNNRLLDCSDAHTWSTSESKDRIGNSFTWVKADPTFAGLQQVLNEPDERVFVGDLPPKLEIVRADKTRYVRGIKIKKRAGANFREQWFDNEIPLNCGLVAVIGNKGKGKSAFVDSVGLLGNTRQSRAFSFLSETSFCNPRDNKARFFEATLAWESGMQNRSSLDGKVDDTQPELVKYIPQNFLETICNEIGGEKETNFDKELKKVIFSHVPESDRLRHSTLDSLIAFRTEEAASRVSHLRSELRLINEAIVELEDQSMPRHRKVIENRLRLKQQEIDAHAKTKPTAVPEPVNDPSATSTVRELSAGMKRVAEERKRLDVGIEAEKSKQGELAVQAATVEKASSKLAALGQQLASMIADLAVDCDRVGISTESLITVSIHQEPLVRKAAELAEMRAKVDASLDSGNAESMISKRDALTKRLTALQDRLDEPNKRYQAYLRILEEWEQRQRVLIGDEAAVGSMRYFEKQFADLDSIPKRLSAEYQRRIEKSKAIHHEINRLADVYRRLYDPVQQFIDNNPIARERFALNFEVAIVTSGLEANFDSFINHGVAGSFCGVDEGTRFLRGMLQKYDLGKEESLVTFLDEMIDALHSDKRAGTSSSPSFNVAGQLKKGQSVTGLYDYLFSLSYLQPRYRLRMGEKELNQLSPGERGTLLLVFYLLIDKEQIPLVIDQPEENLDNQTVFELLVPCIKETKKRRQMIIVTHNPNLAVVCDAEQIICASLEKSNNFRMTYVSGAIEDPTINQAVVDILEGTRPAFNNRNLKYEVSA